MSGGGREMRLDPTTRTWILVGKPPQEPAGKQAPEGCPFCPGREGETPPPIAAITGPDGAWRVRCFPDRSPVFRIEGPLDRTGEGLYDRMRNVGAHEVIVESREHARRPPQFSDAELADVLRLIQGRVSDLHRDPRFRYVLLFRNQGPLAGSLIEHPHSHLVATPVIPRRMEQELRWAKQHFDYKERCLACDILHQELGDGRRLVEVSPTFVAFCPFAPRFPYETWLFPRRHQHAFPRCAPDGEAGLPGLAALLRRTLARIEHLVSDYHVVLHDAPNEQAERPAGEWTTLLEDFHWHLEILPRTARLARLHRDEEFYENPVPPEEAAAALRDAPAA